MIDAKFFSVRNSSMQETYQFEFKNYSQTVPVDIMKKIFERVPKCANNVSFVVASSFQSTYPSLSTCEFFNSVLETHNIAELVFDAESSNLKLVEFTCSKNTRPNQDLTPKDSLVILISVNVMREEL
jgi:hypothetical protein